MCKNLRIHVYPIVTSLDPQACTGYQLCYLVEI